MAEIRSERLPQPRIDHVIIASPDLEATAARLEREHGIVAEPGGRHPAWGTHNRIAPLGGAYLEIIGVEDPALAASDPLGAWVLEHALSGDALMGFAVEVSDATATAQRLGLGSEPGARDRPDGSRLAWTLAGRRECGLGARPFFIEWHDPATRPGLAPMHHHVAVSGLAWLETGGDEAALRAWVGGELPVRSTGGPADGVLAIGISTAAGELVLR